jgi:hypothetical protein
LDAVNKFDETSADDGATTATITTILSSTPAKSGAGLRE